MGLTRGNRSLLNGIYLFVTFTMHGNKMQGEVFFSTLKKERFTHRDYGF